MPGEGFLRAILDGFHRSQAGWKWRLVVLPAPCVSAGTNIRGVSLALPIVPAVALGVGLRTIAL